MNYPDFENIEDIDKDKALALASAFLIPEDNFKLPKNLRIVSNLIIVISALGFVFSLLKFSTESVAHCLLLLAGNITMLICAVGLRLARRWSLYLCLCLYGICLAIYFFLIYVGGPVNFNWFIVINIISVFFILTALYNWRHLQ